MKKIFKTVAIITIFSLLTRILGFILRIILSRAIGPTGLGIYQVAFSVFTVLETFISSGLPLTVSKLTAQYNAQNNQKSKFACVTSALIIGISTAIIICLVILLFRNLIGGLFTDKRCLSILLTLLPSLVFSSVYCVLRGYLWGERKYFWVSVSEFFEQFVRVCVCIIMFGFFYSLFDGAITASISLVIACVLSSIFVIITFVKVKGKLTSPKGEFKKVLKSSSAITGVRIVSSMLMPLIAIIVPLSLTAVGYTNEQALAQYGIAMGMTFPLLYLPSTLIGSLAMTLIPDISSDMATGKVTTASNRIQSAMKFAIFVTFLIMPVYIGLGSSIGLFLYDNITAGTYLSKAAWIMVPICINNIATSALNALGLEVKSFINYIIGACFLILSLLFLPKYIGILSLVWGMGLCMSIAALLNIRMLKKKVSKEINIFSPILKQTLVFIPSVLIVSWTNGILSNYMPLFFSIAISGVIGMGMFLIICEIFKIANLSSFIIEKKQKKKV